MLLLSPAFGKREERLVTPHLSGHTSKTFGSQRFNEDSPFSKKHGRPPFRQRQGIGLDMHLLERVPSGE